MLNGVCVGKTERSQIQKVILDAGPIIHLAELDCLELLLDFRELLVPEAVWSEVAVHRPAAFNNPIIAFEKTSVQQKMNSQITTFCNSLDLAAGETEAIILSSSHPGSILLTDDAAARLAASSLSLRAYGTLGVILRAIRRQQLKPAEAIAILENLSSRSTLFVKHSLLKEIIEDVKKEYGAQG